MTRNNLIKERAEYSQINNAYYNLKKLEKNKQSPKSRKEGNNEDHGKVITAETPPQNNRKEK